METNKKKAIIIGAGPAGLTAAYELLKRTDVLPIILEKSGDIGGISKTINYKGNRMDIGGHRFFSKSDRVMNWWLKILPLQSNTPDSLTIKYQNKSRELNHHSQLSQSDNDDKIMLVRKRLSRIYFLRKFFNYPITLSIETLKKLGIGRTIAILLSYIQAQIFPRRPENSLEDFMINRFGKTLYELFFRDYTEKVWGVPCNKISAEWGAQRIKGVSITKAIQHAAQELTKKKKKNVDDIAQKDTETSLIEQFLYPKLGPGQLWEEVARQVEEMGGIIYMHNEVKKIHTHGNEVAAITAVNKLTGEEIVLEGDYFFSTMPVKELIAGIQGSIPPKVQDIAAGLQYRDFITVGILLKELSSLNSKNGRWEQLQLEDTWIYIQEREVTVGRLQLFNNWSPFMVADPNNVWVGMEFFCNETDEFWQLPDEKISALAIHELEKIGLANSQNVLDSTVLRVEKTYPAYFGTYESFDQIRAYTDQFENLFLVGRNGMHKYNNADHSMLTAMVAVDNIEAEITTKDNIWSINTEQEYHEEKKDDNSTPTEVKKKEQKPQSLRNYIFKEPANKPYVQTALLGIIIQLIFFKYWYPFASFINGDSYAYLYSAYDNNDIDTYPIGYPKFIRLFSVFTHSDTILVIFQYILLQASILSLVFSIFYFFNPSKVTKISLFGFMLFNPVFLYLANYISSDTLFLSLSLIWFNLLIWSIYHPTPKVIFTSSIILFLAFTIRYNALFYPLVAAVAFILYRKKIALKILGLFVSLILIYGFINFNNSKYYDLCGKKQFTPFTGWQIANNAMYAYKFVPKNEYKKTPKKFQDLDNMVRTYFDTTRDYKKHPEEAMMVSTIYMWTPTAPLRQYMKKMFKNETIVDEYTEYKQWATIAPFFKEYGTYLIKAYPIPFAMYYLFPNAIKYYAPPVEFLGEYSTGKDIVSPIAKVWFEYNSLKIITIFKDFKVNILNFYPILVGTMNVIFFLGLISFILLDGSKKKKSLSKALLLVASLWLFNFAFSVFASPIALRFQLFPILVMTSFAFIFMDYLINEAILEPNKNSLITK
ncbi:FAD-dependent oxidoreductase [Chitinophaga sancti]|uniref:FAD-dependent oxidoreductase n=1 Tax=Chitinophaga sancti TaxID=1004 RepID=UPI002A7638B6|nr:FAD-dependent oxidoreductase [Chitinophaga sancti]WPQ63357.1 FAD-dependent oxidoreductase [Chitinophaga sancti]